MFQRKKKKDFKNKAALFQNQTLYILACLIILFIFCIYAEINFQKQHRLSHVDQMQLKSKVVEKTLSINLHKIKREDFKTKYLFQQIAQAEVSNRNVQEQENKFDKNIPNSLQFSQSNNINKIQIQQQNSLKGKSKYSITDKKQIISQNNFLQKLPYSSNKQNQKTLQKKPQPPISVNTNSITFQQILKKQQQNIINSLKSPTSQLVAGVSKDQIQFAKNLSKLQSYSNEQYQQLTEREKNYYQQKYQISQFEEQPFCIVVPSFNNAAEDRYLLNLNSILQQNYSNYHIVFIDDASTDDTLYRVKKYAADHQISQEKLKIIQNKERKMAMPNLYRAAKQFCQSYQIFMVVDGDDYLIGKQILKLYNALFQSKDEWLIYTNFITTRGTMGYSRPFPAYIIEKGHFRRTGFSISHLRAFYTKLFTLVKQQDLKDGAKRWFRAANDVAMYLPILQMAQKKFSYVPQICYSYNSNTGLNNHINKKQQQRGNQGTIKKKPSYLPLLELFTPQQKEQLKKNTNKIIETKNLHMALPQHEVKKYKWE